MYLQRTLEKALKQAEKQFSVLLVTGPRQVGKTTLLMHLAKKGRTYVTLDDTEVLLFAKEEPALFLQRYKPPILIDEVQYAPELLPYIKMYADTHKKMGDFWLTGSQQFQLMQGVTESLAGRVGILQILGLSERELDGDQTHDAPFLPTVAEISKRFASAKEMSLEQIYERIWRGSFPAVALNPEADVELFYSSYIRSYLERDVRQLANVGDIGSFLKFLRAAAARTGQLLNMTDMAKDADISPNTAKNWLSILEASGLVYLLEPYHNNVTKRLIKSPKLYFLDTGLASYLTQWSSPKTLEAGAMSGHMLETFFFIEILKSYWHNGKRERLYYYRDKDQKEIDLLILKDGTIYPLEFKKTAHPSRTDVRHFYLLENFDLNLGEGGVVCLANNYLPLSETLSVIPANCL
jgi:uncharacterized protein